MISISGINFPIELGDVKIGNSKALLISASSNQINIISSKMSPGVYKLSIDVGPLGFAKYKN